MIKIVPIQKQIFAKSPTPQPFSEPENMTTVDLNKNGYLPNDIQNEEKHPTIEKFKVTKIVKSLLVGIGIFILLGLCTTILILIVYRGSYRNMQVLNKTSQVQEISLKRLLNNKEMIKTCRSSKNFEDCCYLFYKSKEFNKCSVQKVLDLFLQYELESNKRIKRQNYDEYNFDYQETYPSDYYNENIYPSYNYDYEQQPYYSNSYIPGETNQYFDENYKKEEYDQKTRIVGSQQQLTTTKPLPTSKSSNPIVETNTWSTTTILPKTCADDKNCPTVINATTKIANISNVAAEPGHLKIALSETNIKLTPNSKSSPRISQGNEFELKPSGEIQTSSQPKQVSPCFYPFPGSFVSPYSPPINFDPNIYGRVPNIQHQPLYVINPPMYPPVAMPFQGYGNYPSPQPTNKYPIQVAGAGGQFYLCNPISVPNNNVAGLQGVEIRRKSEAFNLQDLVQETERQGLNINKTRQAIECPFGTRGCNDGSKCIHNRQFCDNEVNCDDASDELNCSCKNRVGEIRWCDGYLDCPNGEDEQGCFGCQLDEFSCDDWSRFQKGTCIPLSQRCDGIKQCEITGKDEEDCSILTDHLSQHSFYKVSNAAGFLHRNYKGKWYPTCFGVEIFSLDVCRTEAGPSDILPKTHLITSNDNYNGPFLGISSTNGIILSNDCMRNKAVFVECPPMFCGMRLTVTNPFRIAEVDTSAEELLARMHLNRPATDELVGDSRVVGGKPCQPTAWPWVVSIYKNGVFHCGGVLINDLWILTAAHCVDRFWFFYYEIQVGILRRFSYSPMEQNRWATVAIPHEGYNKRSLKNDIALMKLSKPVRFNRYVRPICLPSQTTAGNDFLRGPKPNTVCVAVGWGATVEHGSDPDHLREVEVPILPSCKHIEDKEGDEICAGLSEGGRDACQGDSGGPLMCQNEKNRSQWYLAGIVSHGEGCARPNEPGVYTKVSKYIGWIHENINGKTTGREPLQKCPGYVCQGTKKCLAKKRRCDKIVDCLFGDDEKNCWQSHSPFRSSIVGSKQGLMVDLLNLLDLNNSSEEIDDVSGNSTESVEIKTHFPEYFTCEKMLQTIPYDEKCNKVVNCEDGTDEADCSCVDYLRRFHKDAICDGVTDCRDMSDESNCVKCPQNRYLCRIGQKCVPLENRCDGRPDCISGEDEWDCVSLTDGRTLVLDSDLRPKQSMKGIITINRFGVWRPLCTNASVDNAASIAANVCNLLGFEEYTAFHKLSVADKPLNVTIDGFERYHSSLDELPVCGGLFVGCLNVSLGDNVHELHRDNITSQVELYTSPWNAVIYSDGKFSCTGTILNPHWIITAKACFPKQLPYVTALVGKGKAHFDVEGPHEQILNVEHVALVNESEAILLRTQQKINFNRYVKAAQTTTKSVFIKEHCVAIGLKNKQSKIIVLQPKKNCTLGFRCFETTEICKNKTKLEPRPGVITCNSRNGWYATAIYTSMEEFCNPSIKPFERIDKNKIRFAMGNEPEKISPNECSGFRCLIGNCINTEQICDGVSDCRNGEDEDSNECLKLENGCPLATNCTNYPPCKLSEFRCKSGECVPKTAFCDNIDDCKDKSDEPEECSCRTYLERVHPEKICDGTVNCWNRSDEKNCSCGLKSNEKCGETGLCVSQEMLCDGFRDCPGGEDESVCYSFIVCSYNNGEVLRRTAGVWHSGCFARNHTTSELEEICEKLGFAGGSAKQLARPDTTALKPVKDRFDVVWTQSKGSRLRLRLRTGNEPYVKFVEDSECHKLYLECL
ncbi:serine protease nudel isoform X2 [Tribolium castaneum]|uniref:serine protease nudel isoform X2 n=1 Tax=Tribolium castaneum TaxID=7070 RepID=UPI0030FE60C1